MSDMMNLQEIEARFPAWVPKEIFPYLAHTEAGTSLRALARDAGVHASTVMRQVHALEARREDVLVDRVLSRFGEYLKNPDEVGAHFSDPVSGTGGEDADLTDQRFADEARRVLSRLCEPGSVMAVAADMDKAVIVRETPEGRTIRRGVLEKDIAEALALKSWIACDKSGRISRYRITTTGRTALRSLLAEVENQALVQAEGSVAHPGKDPRMEGAGAATPSTSRFQSADTPLALLARRHDKTGQKFLSPDLVSIGERLREDFELAGFSSERSDGWNQFMARAQRARSPKTAGSSMARERLLCALRDLGPGLGDAALRCCCLLEGLELTEKQMGWSARSGKIVLRIALQRLKRHYDSLGEAGALLG